MCFRDHIGGFTNQVIGISWDSMFDSQRVFVGFNQQYVWKKTLRYIVVSSSCLVCVCRWFEVGVLLTNYSKVLGGSSAPISGVFPYIPGLVNIQKTNWKDPPCYQWVVIHYFDWAMFNFANSKKNHQRVFVVVHQPHCPIFRVIPTYLFPTEKPSVPFPQPPRNSVIKIPSVLCSLEKGAINGRMSHIITAWQVGFIWALWHFMTWYQEKQVKNSVNFTSN